MSTYNVSHDYAIRSEQSIFGELISIPLSLNDTVTVPDSISLETVAGYTTGRFIAPNRAGSFNVAYYDDSAAETLNYSINYGVNTMATWGNIPTPAEDSWDGENDAFLSQNETRSFNSKDESITLLRGEGQTLTALKTRVLANAANSGFVRLALYHFDPDATTAGGTTGMADGNPLAISSPVAVTAGTGYQTLSGAVDYTLPSDDELYTVIIESSATTGGSCISLVQPTTLTSDPLLTGGSIRKTGTYGSLLTSPFDGAALTPVTNRRHAAWAEGTEAATSTSKPVTGGVMNTTAITPQRSGSPSPVASVGGLSSSVIGVSPNTAQGPDSRVLSADQASDHDARAIGGLVTGGVEGVDFMAVAVADPASNTSSGKAVRYETATSPVASGGAFPNTYLNDTDPAVTVDTGDSTFSVEP